MRTLRTLQSLSFRHVARGLAGILITLLLIGCAVVSSNVFEPGMSSEITETAPIYTPAVTKTATATPDIWYTFAPPSIDPVTQVPPPLNRMELPEDVEVWLLLGSDQEPPYKGRTQAFHVLLVNQRLSKASMISIPGNLLVYIPGQTMQRLNTAYSLGGMELVAETIAYNFGIKPDRYVVAHPGDFQWLVDDLGGLEVSVLFPIPQACGGLPAGLHSMNGEKAFCYVSYIVEQDEIDRTRRQQQVLQLLFTKLVQNGRLAQLPVLYASYQDWVETNFSLIELLEKIPMAIRLGDPQRVNYYLIGWGEAVEWELSNDTHVKVLLPDQEKVMQVFLHALTSVLEPAPLGEIVLTYEAQLTAANGMTQTQMIPTLSNITQEPSATYTWVASPTGPWITQTPIPTIPPGSTVTPTLTQVPTAIFPTQQYPISTFTPTPPQNYP